MFFDQPNIQEPADLTDKSGNFPYDIAYAMGRQLCSTNDGDIRLDCPESEVGFTKSLYAHSTILKTCSAYYRCSMKPSKGKYRHTNTEVFASSFAEGDSATETHSKPFSLDSDHSTCLNECTISHQRIIRMTDDFDVVHNILYYIYTNRITFSNVPSEQPQNSNEEPKICDAERIYELAHRLCLESLQSKALGFLQRSCNIRNITSRVFGEFASVYAEAGKIYDDYFRKHWEQVRETGEFKQHFSEMEQQYESKEINQIFTKFRQLMYDANFTVLDGK